MSVGAAELRLEPGARRPSAARRTPRAQHAGPAHEPEVRWRKAERFGLVDLCQQRGIEPVVLHPGDDLRQLAEDAVARGADLIGMAGGDGSQALVASVASRHRIPFVVVPAGTRNHFALDLGLDRDDVPGALDAYHDGVDTLIDLAEVNGRVFVNNASMGVYAKIVQSGDYRDAKVQTAAAMLPDLLGPAATPLDLRFTLPSGQEAEQRPAAARVQQPVPARAPARRGTRERLDSGVLGIAFARVATAVEAEKLAALEAAGRVQRFASWNEWTAPEFEVRSSGPVEVGVDGEALTLQPPAALRHPARRAHGPAAARCARAGHRPRAPCGL